MGVDVVDMDRREFTALLGGLATSAGAGRWRVNGELSVHGVTALVPVEVTFQGGLIDPSGTIRAGFDAQAEIDRDDFGLTWNQTLDTGEVMIGRNVTIDVDGEAVLQR